MEKSKSYEDPFLESCATRIELLSRSISFAQELRGLASSCNDVSTPFSVRKVLSVEIDVLESFCHCRCSDWSRVFVMFNEPIYQETDMILLLKDQVSHCRFEGFVVLGLVQKLSELPDEDEQRLPRFHYNTLVKDCIFEPGSRVYNNTMMEQTHVGCYGSIINCGSLSRTRNLPESSSSFCNFASSIPIHVGPETGGARTVFAFPEMTLIHAARDLRLSSAMGPLPTPSCDKANILATKCPLNIVSSYSMIRDSFSVRDVFLLPQSCIKGSSVAHNVTLLPNSRVEGGTIENSQLQWDAKASYAHVSNSLLMEHSHADKNAKVFSSILGPDCHSSSGEVQHSLLGPHVNSHHQSLIMATIWITGRGNVGYGANIGSNHTGRVADQECWAGEGTFWGLSNVAKFPIDLTQSPYSIVAAGVQFLPQRICMPFSLFTDFSSIVQNSAIISGNQCFPGWILRHSPYTIARSEHKFSTRTKAKRHQHYTSWKIVRPGIIDLCVKARSALQRVNSDNQGPIYCSDADIYGLGKCHLTDAARLEGIQAYTDFIQRYALRGLLEKICIASGLLRFDTPQQNTSDDVLTAKHKHQYAEPVSQRAAAIALPWDENSFHHTEEIWKHQLSILRSEFPDSVSLKNLTVICRQRIPQDLQLLLMRLVELELQFSDMVMQSKKKDDIRGVKIIPGYADCHVKAVEDTIVVLATKEAQRLKEIVREILIDTESSRISSRI